MEEIKPKKRGRPAKSEQSHQGTEATIPKKIRLPELSGNSFFLVLNHSSKGRTLACTDSKGKRFVPDYRMFAGLQRETIRTFFAEKQKTKNVIQWDSSDFEEGNTISNPSSAIIEMAIMSKVLLNEDLMPLIAKEGMYRCVLRIINPGDERVTVSALLHDPESDEVIFAPEEGFSVISQTYLCSENTLYRVADLGPWCETFQYKSLKVQKDDLEVYLSLARSRISSLHIEVPGWETRLMKPVTAKKALLFSEIDAYGYLHIKPLVYLLGYPPGFFEEQELVETVTLDQEASQVRIAEVLYPPNPAIQFRSMLGGKKSNTEIHEEDGFFLISGPFAQRFLEENMESLMEEFTLLQSSVLGKLKIKIAKPRIQIKLTSGIDFLEGSADVEIDNQRISFGSFMREYKKGKFITLSDGSKIWPEQDEINRFERLITKIKGSDDAVAVSFFDIPALAKNLDIKIEGDGWENAEDFYRNYNTIDKRKGNYNIRESVLRSYQEYGVKWLEYLRDNHMGACLADEMGLGKTLQIIVLLRNSYNEGLKGPSLILVPRSLIYNWKAELKRFAPELDLHIYYGLDRDISVIEKKKNVLIISSYATLRNDIEEFAKHEFNFVILDESQNIKNIETKTSAAVFSLKAKYRIAMSGTPIENSLSDLYSLFRFLNPSFFGSAENFSRRYLKPIQESQDEEAIKDLRSRLYPFLLRRAKKDVLTELPDKTEQTSIIELSDEHMRIYNARREELKTKIIGSIKTQGVTKSTFLVLQALTELRRLAGVPEADGEFDGVSAKREYIKDMVVSIAAEGHKCLIFTNFLASVDLVSQDLADAGIGNLVMTGVTRDRHSLVEQFQTDPGISAFIMTIKTGGVGLNLTAADYVFILDPWWNRAAEQQAIDRTHRIGQKNSVFCYRMIAKGTIEEKILELQEKKAGIAEALLSADGTVVKKLTEADIEYLMG